MSGNPKFAILEKDGIELSYQQEYVPEASDILYETGSEITLREFVDKPPLIRRVWDDKLTIPANHVMIVKDLITYGDTLVEGELVIL